MLSLSLSVVAGCTGPSGEPTTNVTASDTGTETTIPSENGTVSETDTTTATSKSSILQEVDVYNESNKAQKIQISVSQDTELKFSEELEISEGEIGTTNITLKSGEKYVVTAKTQDYSQEYPFRASSDYDLKVIISNSGLRIMQEE